MKNFKTIFFALIILLIVGTIFYHFRSNKPAYNPSTNRTEPVKDSQPHVVSTSPSPLDNSIIMPNQQVKITFNQPILNPDELKRTITPDVKYTLTLSDDRKTAIITPNPTFEIGTGYTLIIHADYTKFDGGQKLPQDLLFHFNTIDYKGV